MCLAVFAIKAHAEFPFICLANRDEFHDRPTAPLQAWAMNGTTLWAGKDLQSGGTWLGVCNNGEFSLLTNVRNSTLNMPGTAPSRGQLVLDALQTGKAPSTEESTQYAGFNLVHGNLHSMQLRCTSNQGLRLGTQLPFSQNLQQGIHSLSNGNLDALWPKSRWLKAGLLEKLQAPSFKSASLYDFEQDLLALLSRTGLANDDELPSTGVPYDWEKMLSAIKIVSPLYGTRSSAVLLLDRKNTVHFTEITLNPAGDEIGRQRFEIPLQPKL